MNFFEANQKRTHPLWRAFAIVYVLGVSALNIYWIATESGPARWLAEIQAEHFFNGSWYPKLTFLFLLLFEIAPLVPVKLAVDRALAKRQAPP